MGPIKVTVTGAAGQIAYNLLPDIVRGFVFGMNQQIKLKLLEIPVPEIMKKLEGVVMELEDSASHLLESIDITDDPLKAFDGSQYAFLVGAKPRSKGMDRKELLEVNAPVFVTQGKALNARAAGDIRILVVGNPANTNALIVMHNAPEIKPEQISAMTRLDQNRARFLIAKKLGFDTDKIRRVIIWGNHSDTLVPDLNHALAERQSVKKMVDEVWYKNTFIPGVAERGVSVIEARGTSSALSAAIAAGDAMREWVSGTKDFNDPESDWASMSVYSQGEYGAPVGVYFSFPCVCPGDGKYSIVPDLQITEDIQFAMNRSGKELLAERDVMDFICNRPV